MKKILLDVSYDGTNYAGWQIQPNGLSIEEVLRESLNKNNINYSQLASSGRTDAGVHALHQKISFFTDSTIPENKFNLVLNTSLPDDIRILNSRLVNNDFHARYSAIGKHYTYFINQDNIGSPFKNKYSWNYSFPVDFERIKSISKELEGKHDYKAFMKTGSSVKSTVREIYKIKPEINGNDIRIDFIGNGFLYNMVRILTGTILQYGSGHLSNFDSKLIFDHPDRNLAGKTAPAKGLFLNDVFYTQKDLKQRLQEIDN